MLSGGADGLPVTPPARILVTGASGLVGASLCLSLCERGFRVVGVSNKHRISIPNVHAATLDLLDRESVRESLPQFQPSAVVHCAAATDVDWCEQHEAETMRMNRDATADVASASRTAAFLYISTDSVFDGRRGAYNETDTPNPLNVYAASKLAGEQAAAAEHPAPLIIRTNVYGYNLQPKKSLAEWVLAELEAGKSIPAFCDVIFAPLFVNDLAALIERILAEGLTGLYHAACTAPASKYQFALQLASSLGLDQSLIRPVSVDSANFRAKRPKNTSLVAKKLEQALHHPMPTLAEGIGHFHLARKSGYLERLQSYGGN